MTWVIGSFSSRARILSLHHFQLYHQTLSHLTFLSFNFFGKKKKKSLNSAAQADLKLTILPRLVLNSEQSSTFVSRRQILSIAGASVPKSPLLTWLLPWVSSFPWLPHPQAFHLGSQSRMCILRPFHLWAVFTPITEIPWMNTGLRSMSE